YATTLLGSYPERVLGAIATADENRVLGVPFAARPSFADWIRETTRAAGAGAKHRDQAFG
ncbi:MAG TPA: hypothetical protein VKE50_03625, partial [Thermoanaerobaculia bacterium]|nr:hypothetical protein [Thermoanaerobaculia bacterium]